MDDLKEINTENVLEHLRFAYRSLAEMHSAGGDVRFFQAGSQQV